MRLFIAINFEKNVRDEIINIIEGIKKYAKQGRFVCDEHIHLTLEFLGEVPEGRVKDIESIMEQINATPFTLSLSDLGYFKRKDGNIYWLGIHDNKDLITLQLKLHNLLQEKGFKLEKRKYRPHITIGRRVRLIDSFNLDELRESINKSQIGVNSIDLMESKNVNGKLVYTRIFCKLLC